jgi:hypothetical protein
MFSCVDAMLLSTIPEMRRESVLPVLIAEKHS